jgi:hypothetical protein
VLRVSVVLSLPQRFDSVHFFSSLFFFFFFFFFFLALFFCLLKRNRSLTTCKFCALFRRLGGHTLAALLKTADYKKVAPLRAFQPILAYIIFKATVLCDWEAFFNILQEEESKFSMLRSIMQEMCRAGGEAGGTARRLQLEEEFGYNEEGKLIGYVEMGKIGGKIGGPLST